LLLSLGEHATTEQLEEPVTVCVFWNTSVAPEARRMPRATYHGIELADRAEEFLADERAIDLVVSTRLLPYRGSIPSLLAHLPAPVGVEANCAGLWQNHAMRFAADLKGTGRTLQLDPPWRYVSSAREIPDCERSFLGRAGKTQDGLASRYVNRPLSRTLSRWLLKLPLTPSTWSVLIFALPIAGALFLCRGTYAGFLIGFAIFQLYSISTAAMARLRARSFCKRSSDAGSTASWISPVMCSSHSALALASSGKRPASGGSTSPKVSLPPRSR
jgi:hypothetical protein